MFVRKLALCVVLFCFVSLFAGVPFAEAHPSQESRDDFETAKEDMNSALKSQKLVKDEHEQVKGLVKELLSAWDTNSDAIKDGTWNLTNTVIATIIAETLRNTNNDDGKSNAQQWLEALPSVLGAVNVIKQSKDLADKMVERDQYLFSLNTALAALDQVVSDNQAAFDAYETEYDVYVKEAQDHAGGMVREPNHSSSGDYSAYTAMELEDIKDKVKHKDAYDVDPKQNDLKFWYHIDVLKETSHPSSFSFEHFEDFDSFWKLEPLEKKYKCGGGCGLTYETPVENMVVCPYPLTESTFQAGGKTMRNLPMDVPLNGQAAPAGCGDLFYLCSTEDREEHRVRKCGKKVTIKHKDGTKTTRVCGVLYRNCTNVWIKHKGDLYKSYHGPGRSGWSWSPASPLLNALPGNSYTVMLSGLEAYSSVEWYVAAPGTTGRGVFMETDSGDGSSTTAEFT